MCMLCHVALNKHYFEPFTSDFVTYGGGGGGGMVHIKSHIKSAFFLTFLSQTRVYVCVFSQGWGGGSY